MNSYYSVKDQDSHNSFIEAKWLTPYELMDKLRIRNFHSYQLNVSDLIYPNELIFSLDSKKLVDVILIAKYANESHGSKTNLKFKSILLSQLISSLNVPASSSSTSPSNRLFILSLPKDTYYWSKVNNANLIAFNALRVGYDSLAKQFAYIGRLKFNSLLGSSSGEHQPQQAQAQQYTVAPGPHSSTPITPSLNNNLFGSLINIYEYIPAIVMQFNDLSYLYSITDESVPSSTSPVANQIWSRLGHLIKNSRQTSIDFNLTSTNYEVLCLKKQPATLKQLCVKVLNKYEEDLRKSQRNLLINRTFDGLPYSIRNLLWPFCLTPGQCLIKNGKMRSLNGVYELTITTTGLFRFRKCAYLGADSDDENDLDDDDDDYGSLKHDQVITIEKNIESLLILTNGVYLIYDNNQATRKPNVLYEHMRKSPANIECYYMLELTNDGYLRVRFEQIGRSHGCYASYNEFNKSSSVDIYNLNDYFSSSKKKRIKSAEIVIDTPTTSCATQAPPTAATVDTNEPNENKVVSKSLYINVRLMLGDLKNLKYLPVKLFSLFFNVLKSVLQSIIYRKFPYHHYNN